MQAMKTARLAAAANLRRRHPKRAQLIPRHHTVLTAGNARHRHLKRNNPPPNPPTQFREELCVTQAHNPHLK